MDYKIVSIVAYDRSGTTFLGNLLHFYSNVFNVGEIDRGIRKLKEERTKPCSCGIIIDQCDLWKNTTDIDLRSNNINCKIYDWIAKQTKCDIIIDTSKSFAQIKKANKHKPKDHLLIHIVRNPKGVIFSRLKARKRRVNLGTHPKPGIAQQYNLMLIFDSIEWCLENLWMEFYKKGKSNVISLIYEDLEEEFENKIVPFLKQKGGLQIEKSKKVSHVLAGNSNRFTSNTQIKIDKKWQQGLENYQGFLVDFLTFPMRLWFGYKFK